MKNISYLLLPIFLFGCLSLKGQLKNASSPTKFIFSKTLKSTSGGLSNLYSKQDSLNDATYDSQGKDSLKVKQLKALLKNVIPPASASNLVVELINDSIWRSSMQDEIMVGDYFMVEKDNGILHYYDKTKTHNYRKYDLFSENDAYEISEDRSDEKVILGYPCYKLTLVKKQPDSDLGNTIYEMYVTNHIHLPVHSVINLSKLIPNTFPMEIKIWEEKLSGLGEHYELVSIE